MSQDDRNINLFVQIQVISFLSTPVPSILMTSSLLITFLPQTFSHLLVLLTEISELVASMLSLSPVTKKSVIFVNFAEYHIYIHDESQGLGCS